MEKKNLTTSNWVPAHEANIEDAIQDAKFESELKKAFNQQPIVINQSQLNVEPRLIDFSKLAAWQKDFNKAQFLKIDAIQGTNEYSP